MANFDLGQLIYRITGDNSELKKVLKESEGNITGFAGVMKGVGKSIGAIFGALGVGLALKDMIEKAADAEKNMAKLNQVIKATGGAAGVTSEYAQELAKSFSQVSEYSEEDIISAETLLLKFKSIGKDIFPEVTQATLDLSAAMGTDLKSSAQLLGKALQDPTTGMMILRRAGVDLSAEQKKQIENFMKVGDVASAQKVILTELSKVVGGQAAAAADTFSGRLNQVKNSLDKLEENLGGLGLGLKNVFEGWIIILNGMNNAIEFLTSNASEGRDKLTSLDSVNAKILETNKQLYNLKKQEIAFDKVNPGGVFDKILEIREYEAELGKLIEKKEELKATDKTGKGVKGGGLTDEQMKGIEEYEKAQAESYKTLAKMNADYQMQKVQLDGNVLKQLQLEEANTMQAVYDLKLANAVDTEEALKNIHEVYLKKKEQMESASAQKIAQTILSFGQQSMGQLTAIIGMYYGNKLSQIDIDTQKQMDSINQTYEAEVEKINALPLSEKVKNEKLKALDEKKSRDELAVKTAQDKKMKKIQHEQFDITKQAQIIQAQMSTALGIVNALATPAPWWLNMAMAIIIGAMGTAQTALIAQQPNPYAQGGMIPGNPSDGDNTLIRATPGEVILNKAQQANVAGAITPGGGRLAIYFMDELLYDKLYDASQNGELIIDKRAVVSR